MSERCYHKFYTPYRPGRLNDGEFVERCAVCDCLPVGRDEETDKPYCDCCVKTTDDPDWRIAGAAPRSPSRTGGES